MKTHRVLAAFITVLLGSVITAQAQSEMAATLTGDQEVPPVATIAFGTATFDVNLSEGTLGMNYTLSATNLKQAFMAHIHCAPEGVNGPIVVQLAGTAPGNRGFNVNGPWIGSAELTDANVQPQSCPTPDGPVLVNNLVGLLNLMVRGLTYVNIHTTANGSGEIRGQVEVVAPFTIP